LQVLRNVAFDNAGFTATNINDHLANLRDGLTGFDTSGFTINTPGVDPTLTQMKSRLLAWSPAPFDHGLLSDSSPSLVGGTDMKDAKTMVSPGAVDRWSAFISGSVVLANLDNTMSNIGDSNYTTGSVMAGADYRLTDHLTVGALFDYAHTSADLDGNGSKATVDGYAPGIYGSYADKGWYGNAMVMYGFNSDTEDRHVTIPGINGVNHGASDGGQLTSNFTGGYEFQRGDFKFGPIASLQYVHLNVGSFQENGPTSLSIGHQNDDSLRSQLGFEARYSAHVTTCYGPLELTPHFQASWQHEYMDNSDGINSQFNTGAGGGSFIVQGQQPERDSAFLDLGLDGQVSKNVTLFIDYQTQAGQNNFSAQSAQGGMRVGF
jgi:outer membrane autotransporter protein